MNAKDLLIYQALTSETSGSSEPSVTVEPLEVMENGEYTAPEGTAYSPVTVNVPSGGGGVSEDDDVLFVDYDGTLLYSYSAEDFLALSEMPENPSHEGLVAQGWNWTLADAQAYVRECGMQVIGQMYTTESGATEIDIILEEGRLSPLLGVAMNGTAMVDWGDGSAEEQISGTSNSTPVNAPHTYPRAGRYTIKISVTSGMCYLIGSSYTTKVLWANADSEASLSAAYRNAIEAVRIGQNTAIDTYAFAYCYSLKSVVMSPGGTNLAAGAFKNCYALSGAVVPSGVQTIRADVWAYTYAARLVSFPKSVNSIGTRCFNYASITKCALPSSLVTIDSDTFKYAYSLKRVAIPSSVRYLNGSAFLECKSLEEVEMPDTIQSIPSSACASLYSCKKVKISAIATSIAMNAFQNAYCLSRLSIPARVATIGSRAFAEMRSLAVIRFEGATPPNLDASTVFANMPTDCIIEVPAGTLSAYTSAANYPNPATYTYREFTA